MMFMNLDDFLSFLKNKKAQADRDEHFAAWPQIAVLTSEERLKHKALINGVQTHRREIELLVRKIEAIDAQMHVDRDEFWNSLYNAHGLPPTGNYHISDDGRILMEPRK